MEVLLILIILGLAGLTFAAYRASKHRGDQSVEASQHELFKNQRGGGFTI